MCELVGTGMRIDKGFKEVHVNKVAKALQEFTGEHVTGTQVYNHLHKWRQRWARVCKFRDLSGALWDALMLTDKIRIHLRSASVRTYTFFTMGIP
jgi:hypothetical protein